MTGSDATPGAALRGTASAVMTEEVRVFVCDDQADIRHAVRHAVDTLPGFVVTGEAATGPACLEALASEPTDLIILDVNLPGGGPPLAEALRGRHPTMVIVVFSAHAEPDVQDSMRRAGAHEYVVKTGRLAPLSAALLRHAPLDR